MLIKPVPSAKAPLDLLLEADPSVDKIRRYLENSSCYVATIGNKTVGAYVIQPIMDGVFELMNIAVAPAHQGKGIGAKLLEHAVKKARELGAGRLELGTGTFGYQLAFYQRAGFRAVAVERDHFLTHYDEPIYENGIQYKDRLRLALEF
ncbi:IAA acetyltransferase [Litchfieldella anticariensis FP35 = DSM 16096]|uniref:IAA acetyltransferase n=1 Tax=Litchfieldella anticariensis (strain DSM 16096 / CECT 5854 / CIP 108499 / LMG 22089 / FP35) TaxID=1121939 RepID=S2L5S1_LITA3|nr:GNAT family N-acetyltransferase [Halomonas anticariensis]EPC03074.1 IAA acetyltransferase [Halomonas anticariensis FP35 = DSM 16096]